MKAIQYIKTLPATFAFVLTFALTFLFVPTSEGLVNAIVPFGGPITYTTYCTCSANLNIVIGPPVGGSFAYQPGGTMTYPYGQVYKSGSETLGDSAPGVSCFMYVGIACSPMPGQSQIMLQIGTSM